MTPIRIKAVVPRNHRVEISLPAEVPEGPVELEVRLAPASTPAGGPDGMLEVLAMLHERRKAYAGPPVNLSGAVRELRDQEG